MRTRGVSFYAFLTPSCYYCLSYPYLIPIVVVRPLSSVVVRRGRRRGRRSSVLVWLVGVNFTLRAKICLETSGDASQTFSTYRKKHMVSAYSPTLTDGNSEDRRAFFPSRSLVGLKRSLKAYPHFSQQVVRHSMDKRLHRL